jgi:capsular polysaccharide biosynthesis protein
VDPAYVPTVPVRPRPVIISIIAGTLGLLISLGLAFVLEYTDTTVKTATQIEAALGLTTLAVIPLITLRAGAVPEHSAVEGVTKGAVVAPVEGEVASI